ncbi:MAG: flagellar hook-associated protein 2 [Silanimonas sp.]|nr:MAG: flagellar hook-associated protein 2 [Silanimonas sp.]
MASLSSPGIGSGLNVSQLVAQLVAAERAPSERRIARQEADARADLSAFTQVRSVLSTLQGAADALAGAGGAGRRAVVQQGAGFTATASASAALGRYSVEVVSLAAAQKQQSAAVSPTADLGTGTLTFTVDGESYEVVLDGPTTTIAQLRDAINTATAGRGLSATVVRGDAGDVLVLNSAVSGSAGGISVAASGSIATFASSFSVTTAAADAVVRVDGVTRTSSSNQLTDLISGVTLELTKAEPGSPFFLDVTADSTALRSSVQAFIGAYNAALSVLRNVSAFNPETRVAAPLAGDAAIRGIQQSLRGALGDAAAELSALGIRSSKDGSLSLDAAKFDEALAADPAAVRRLFDKTSPQSLGARLADRLGGAVAPGSGLLEGRTKALNDRLKALQADRDRLDVRIQRIEEGYRRQFTALDGLVAQLQSTSTFLAQELARLPGVSSR